MNFHGKCCFCSSVSWSVAGVPRPISSIRKNKIGLVRDTCHWWLEPECSSSPMVTDGKRISVAVCSMSSQRWPGYRVADELGSSSANLLPPVPSITPKGTSYMLMYRTPASLSLSHYRSTSSLTRQCPPRRWQRPPEAWYLLQRYHARPAPPNWGHRVHPSDNGLTATLRLETNPAVQGNLGALPKSRLHRPQPLQRRAAQPVVPQPAARVQRP